ncbi:MAG: T9SS type A sorting domain-containing protein [Melioribacteraceae bacterium]|nr:T9SS type A sorting domain-containing protein [Melioribacteraceae bacterium]
MQLSAQSITINGRVTYSRIPVQFVSVTFIDNEDTTKQFTTMTDDRGNYEIGLITDVNDDESNTPTRFSLGQSYPNPFSSSAAIPYGLTEESNVEVTIYDILGRLVRKYDAGRQIAGLHSVIWDGRNRLGQTVANGIYFYRLIADGEPQVKKMIFNQNGNGSFMIPGSFSVNHSSLKKTNVNTNIFSNTFKVRIQNTSTTNPIIIPETLENVVVQNDTTINISATPLPLVKIDCDSLHQVIRGFGAANILMWRPDMTDYEIETAFGNEDGQLGFTILRIMVEPDSNRWSASVPSAQKALDLGAIIIAAPWYAPSNMVENYDNRSRVRPDMYDEYAGHLNAFVKYMNRNSVPIYGLSIQNEPDITDSWTSWSPDEMLTFMRDYADAIEGTLVMAPESFQFRRNMTDPILNDSAATANTDIICGHIYGGGLAVYPLAEEKGKEVWMTEHLSGEDSQANDWDWAVEVANEMNAVMQANMSAYVWWYLVRYYGPISDGTNNSGRKSEVTKKGYVMSQFSRFIRPGYFRVESNVSPFNSDVEVTAYKDPLSSKIVIVAINNGPTSIDHTFMLENIATTTFATYTTTITKNCRKGDEYVVTNGTFNFTLDPISITTFVSE